MDRKTQLQQAMEKQRRLQAEYLTDPTKIPILSFPSTAPAAKPRLRIEMKPDTRTAEEKAAANAKWQADRERQQKQDRIDLEGKRRSDLWGRVVAGIGQRYADRRLNDWETYGTPAEQAAQANALERIKAYMDNMRPNVAAGKNLVLFGSRGTGKDFVLSNVMRRAVLGHGIRCLWRNGSSLYLAVRDSMRPGSNMSEKALIEGLVDAPILAISDPLPPTGPLTEFQATTMLDVIDGRYRADKPTWLTCNVTNRAELEARMGVLLVDRLLENAESVFFSWPSYRQKTN